MDPPNRPDDLYIMRYAFRSDCVKIGRRRDPERRRHELEGPHIFRVEIVEIFPGKGYLEQTVHKLLEDRRNTEGAGTEWFNVDVATAIKSVNEAVPIARKSIEMAETTRALRQAARALRQSAIALRQSARGSRQRGGIGPKPKGRPPKAHGRGTEPRGTPPGE